MKITDFTSTKLAEFDEKFSSLRAVRRDPDDHPITDDLKADYSRAITEAYLLGLRRAEEVVPKKLSYERNRDHNPGIGAKRYINGSKHKVEAWNMCRDETTARLEAIRKEIDGTV